MQSSVDSRSPLNIAPFFKDMSKMALLLFSKMLYLCALTKAPTGPYEMRTAELSKFFKKVSQQYY